MGKETRVNKYKDLRDEMKEEVTINRHIEPAHVEDEDDDFLAFMPHEEEKKVEDTLIEPLSYETLQKDDEEINSVLNEAKANVRKEQYNTRIGILNKIKQDEGKHAAKKDIYQQETTEIKEEPKKKMTLLEKLAAMSPEEDAEELRKFEEGMTVADLMSQKKKKKDGEREN